MSKLMPSWFVLPISKDQRMLSNMQHNGLDRMTVEYIYIYIYIYICLWSLPAVVAVCRNRAVWSSLRATHVFVCFFFF